MKLTRYCSLLLTTLFLTIYLVLSYANCQYETNDASSYSQSKLYRRERVSWCCTSLLEKKKCLDWARAIEEVNVQFEGQEPFEMNLDCVLASDKDQCMLMVDDERADLVLLDPGEISVAGRYHSLTPIMSERYGPSKTELGKYSVAVVKKRNQNIQTLSNLYGKKVCFSGVSHMSSWALPIASLIDLPLFEISDCNNLVKSVSHFFGNSCAPGALINKFNPSGDNPQTITSLCDLPQTKGLHAQNEPYNGALSALRCLSDSILSDRQFYQSQSNQTFSSSFDNRFRNQPSGIFNSLGTADVTFVPISAVFLAEKLGLRGEFQNLRNELELLCPQGGRQPIDRWQTCNFGFAPASGVVVSSQKQPETKAKIQRFLKTSVQLFGQSIVLLSSNQLQSTNKPPVHNFQQQLPPLLLESRTQNLFDPSNRDRIVDTNLQANGRAGLVSTFSLTGDSSLITYPNLDVLFSSDMTDLVALNGVQQTVKGYLNSFPVQLASSSASAMALPGFNKFQSQQLPSSSSFFNYFSSSDAQQQVSANDGGQSKILMQTDYFDKIRKCPAPAVIMCVTSEREFVKCQAMGKAFHAASLKPDLSCKLARSSLACMQLIHNRDADLTVLDPADLYFAGSKFNLIPILSEQVEAHESKNYAVAVAKKSEANIDLYSLQGKRSCHSGFFKAAGWVMPISFLTANDRIRTGNEYECNSARAVAEHFDKSCVPGILSSSTFVQPSQSKQWLVRNMCEICHGSGRSYCARDASEPFFGDTGAFRCLVEGGGDVAFFKHTAIHQNTGGINRETWARNLIKSDYELLCRDGNRASVDEYETCNLGSIPNNAVVTRGDNPISLIDAYINLFLYGQQQYGSKYSEEYTFKMFSPSTSNTDCDLIFQDSTQLLVKVPLFNQTYKNYLNKGFLSAIELISC